MSTSQIDPRGPQLNAALTSVVLAVVLATAPGTVGVVLLAVQAALFATGVVLGVQRTPAAFLFKRVVRPRLAPPMALEDADAPRFAQGVGLAFAVVGLVGYLIGLTPLGVIATGLALVAALLNAVLRLCLGCKLYGVCKVKTPADAGTPVSRPVSHPVSHSVSHSVSHTVTTDPVKSPEKEEATA